MSDRYELENNAIDGEDEMGSLNQSTVQINLGGLLKFKCDKKLAVMSELSLDISQYDLSEYELGVKEELKPDVCAYIKRPLIPKGKNDLVRVSQMPDLVIEILSPRQAIDYLIRKINAYFELGVKSCWLVIPSLDEVRVFSQPRAYKSFDLNSTEIVDEVMEISMPIAKVFAE
ncbi:MAG TPA: Uma2 family endonuclease [Thiotrichaceae bacterium]|nr:Uma2 family endonuclease [Thiotrichaceae bacterium]